MKPVTARLAVLTVLLPALGACVGPIGPSPGLAPPPGAPGAVSADYTCRQYADAQIAPMRDQANTQAIGSTLVGAGLGAALGGAIGGGRGAGIGAASGALVGTGVGASNAQNATGYIQQQYNAIYANCMASQGAPPPPAYGAPVPTPYGYGAPVPPPPRY